jgi:bifunctional UDP-N-acetylglucosamine pyrophosphorylase/glucosamine-1-phosphate N-acetyltransferase
MMQLSVVILAAGKGERMLSNKPKVMHEIMGKPMVGYAIERAQELSTAKTVVVLGYGREFVEEHVKDYGVTCAFQKGQKGTAHALLSAEKIVKGLDVLVLYGDVPLLERSTLEGFLNFFRKANTVTFMTTDVENPAGYGRVLMKKDRIEKIVEEIDASPEEKKIKRINTGICAIPGSLFPLLKAIKADNKKGEYYLTDICKIAQQKGIVVKGYHHGKSSEVLGINSREELLEANVTMKDRVLDGHMKNGVTLFDRNIYIESNVTIQKDTTIFPNTYILGKTRIGEGVSIGPNVFMRDSVLHDRVTIEGFVVMEGAELEEGVRVGPFSRIRPTTLLKKGVQVGNFVEVKNSVLDQGSKANHLTYIGDTEIGKDVNIGAGTITCNYDGKKKHKTIIEDNVFVGSNTELVAPVRVGKYAIIGAGSTITRDVPEGALAVSRAQQRHIKGHGRKKQCAE